jgi:hypothetical protein
MAYTQKIQPDVKFGDGGVVQINPYWILLVIPYQDKFSVDTKKIADYKSSVSKSGITAQGTSTPILLDNHCIKWSVSSSKSSHTTNASFTLTVPSVIEYDGKTKGVPTTNSNETRLNYYNITANDWVMFWAMKDYDSYKKVKNSILAGNASNDRNSGLKFVGKVTSFRSSLSVGGNGVRLTTYNMSCHGFKEFNNSIYYSQLAQPTTEIRQVALSNLASEFNNFLVSGDAIYATTQTVVPLMTNMLFSCVFQQNLNDAVGNAARGTEAENSINARLQSESPNRPLLVPNKVMDLLGVKHSKIGIYTDILAQYIGLEGRNGDGSYYPSSFESQREGVTLYQYPDKMDSQMLKQTLNLDGSTVWSILQTYLNHPVNEMFTCMRVDPHGKIMPSLVCRQIPFNSKLFKAATPAGSKVTAFIDLPRWEIDEAYIMNYNIGMDETTAINYVRIEPILAAPSGQAIDKEALRQEITKSVRPIVDAADVERNGLKMYVTQLSSVISNTDEINKLKFWNGMIADIYMKARYSANGTVMCKGIQDPVALGDNVVVKGTLFHIEGMTHEGGIDASGKKNFTSSFNLSYGIPVADNIVENSTPSATQTKPSDGLLPQEEKP